MLQVSNAILVRNRLPKVNTNQSTSALITANKHMISQLITVMNALLIVIVMYNKYVMYHMYDTCTIHV